MTEAEWALVELFVPSVRRGGRKREVSVREVINAIFYLEGCQWNGYPTAEERGMIISFFSIVMVLCNACTRHSISWRVSTLDVRSVRRLHLSAARARKPLKKGLWTGPARM